MMTSRSEYRLLLRQDNAAARLTPKGRALGLISDARWERFLCAERQREAEITRLKTTTVAPCDRLNEMLLRKDTVLISTGVRLAELLRRPQISYAMLAPFDEARPSLPASVAQQVEVEIKYEGYIQKQLAAAQRMQQYRRVSLAGIDFLSLRGLAREAQEKLHRASPENIGQAMGISGVSPADISILMLAAAHKRRGEEAK
jgi:tRNA uridine 5-carboxymethylaminomethyl modification enzyme